MHASPKPSDPSTDDPQPNTPPRAQEARSLPGGKVPGDLLAQLLSQLPTEDPRLLLGPGVGEDAAVLDLDAPQLLVAKSDPITFATDEIGYYAVNVCANDLAVTGARPLFYLPTLLFPEGSTTEATVRAVFGQLARACRQLGVVVVGGHSEVTPTVNQVVVAGTMLGQVEGRSFVTSGGCQPGDRLLLAGMVPVEGTSIIAREKREELLARGWSPEELQRAANFLYEPGISVLTPARLAAEAGLVTAMHDPTEGGVATGLLELSLASGLGLEVDLDAIPVPELSRRLCAEFGLDPLGVIASGALLATAREEQAADLLARWEEAGWPGAVIGRILPRGAGVHGLRQGRPVPLPRFPADEITRLWS